MNEVSCVLLAATPVTSKNAIKKSNVEIIHLFEYLFPSDIQKYTIISIFTDELVCLEHTGCDAINT